MDNKNDLFANIALQRITHRDSALIEPQPPLLPEKYLPSDKNDQKAIFTPISKIDSFDSLSSELDSCRKKYKKYFDNFAPLLPSERTKIELTTFDWRIETEKDQKDFLFVLAGQGTWEKVSIPHYGEPLGLAITYYRTECYITKEHLLGGAAFIHFKGVDYKCHVFVNGCFIGSHEGFFAPFEFDFTDCAKIGDNTIVIKVENDFIMGGNTGWGQANCGDKIYAATGLGYDDPIYGWHHCPPGMGIYQDVCIEFRPRIFISDISVRPLPQSNSAEAWIEIHNCDAGQKEVSLSLSLYGQNFEKTVFENMEYKPISLKISGLNDDLNIALAKADGTYNKLVPLYMERGINYLKIPFEMNDFRLWDNETPWLYQLQVKLLDGEKQLLDAQKRHFGMRSFRMDEDSSPKGALYLNDNPIRLRGANTMGHEQQCVFKKDFDQLIDDILLAKICNMNFLRLTQRPVQPEVYDYCDMLGLMTQTDLPTFGCIRKNQYNEALRQVGEMEKLVRSHPCNIMISYINEPFPNGQNRPHRNVSRDEMEDFFRAASDIVHHLNPDRVIKPCDGDYDPPSPGIQDRHCYPCWYNGHGGDIGMLIKGYWQPTKADWYYGCGEFGSEALESQELMRKYYPAHWLPQNKEEEKTWSPSSIVRAQTGMFHHFFYDTQNSVEDWIEASQEHQKRSLKMMTETFRRNNDMVTFAVHLFIDAWPSGWMKTIMDCERQPKKGYFAYRNALSPLLPSIRTDRTKFFAGEKVRMEAWISNDLLKVPEGISFHYQLECDSEIIFAQKTKAEIEICKSTFQGYIEFDAPEVIERKTMTVRVA
ncbi:MAG TPA: glycoside hydrolase family 2 TIM barrel-domain containing protein, partial [Desulfobacterales bacterium]|nr:glycoside hydrolase family 2 TIM barrel-domain containing protein [Desulfobacterales bacterium]